MQLKICDNHPSYSILSDINVINCLEELAVYRELWNKILIENNNTNPYLEFDWIDRWWNSFGKEYRLFIIVLKKKERIVGFCPLMILRRMFFKEITFIGYPEASYMEFILAKEGGAHGVKAALDYLMSLKGNYILHLHGLYEESETYKTLANYFNQNQHNFLIRSFEDLYIRMNEDFTSYLKKCSRHNAIKTLIKNKSKLEGLGDVIYKELESSEFDDIFQLHEMRWKKKYDTSSFSKKEHKEFFRTIANNTNLSFQVKIYGLMLGNRIIAFVYGIQCNGTYYFYRISHNNDFSVFCPGKIILMKLLEDCFHRDIKIFDFGLGYAKYKSEWTEDKKIIYELVAPLASGFSRIIYYRYLLRKTIIHQLKKFKFYDTLKERMMGIIFCFFTGVYFKEIIQTIKKGKVIINIRDTLKNKMKNLYSHNAYMIYEKSFDYLDGNTMKKEKTYSYKGQEESKGLLDTLSDSKADIMISEANLNDLELLCQLRKEKPAQIIKRFYQKQRCFIMNVGNSSKDYLWINCNYIEIPEINYTEKLSKNSFYINLSKLDASEDSVKDYLKAINCIINMLKLERLTICYSCFNPKREFLKKSITDIGFVPTYLIEYKKVLFKSRIRINKCAAASYLYKSKRKLQ